MANLASVWGTPECQGIFSGLEKVSIFQGIPVVELQLQLQVQLHLQHTVLIFLTS